MFTITIQAESFEQMRDKVCALGKHFGLSFVEDGAAQAPMAASSVAAVKKSGKVKAAKEEPQVPAQASPAAPVMAPSSTNSPSRNDAMRALQKVMETRTPEKALEVLKGATGKTKLSDVEAAQYAALIVACEVELSA